MTSEARARLSRLFEVMGENGVLLLPKWAEGADLPPGSMEFPPCQCPQHRTRTDNGGTRHAVS